MLLFLYNELSIGPGVVVAISPKLEKLRDDEIARATPLQILLRHYEKSGKRLLPKQRQPNPQNPK